VCVLTLSLFCFFCFILLRPPCSQQHCQVCHLRVSRSEFRNYKHVCSDCVKSIPDNSPSVALSPTPSRSPAPPPLFDRNPSSLVPLSSVERSAVVTLRLLGFTQQAAAQRLGCSRHTIASWQHRFEDTGNVLDLPRSGRPSSLSDEEKEELVMVSSVNSRYTPKKLKVICNSEVSTRTIDRTLQAAGLFGRVAAKKRIFTDEDKRKRLSFAAGYSKWSEEDWDHVVFADEAVIEGAGAGHGRVWVRRERGVAETFTSEHSSGRIPHPIKMNVWACFTGRGVGYCYIFNENMNGKLFKHILDTHLIQSAQLHFSSTETWWLLQDNAPTHKAKVVTKWLHNHGIQQLEFPPYSPDLNPIENLWQYIEQQVEERGTKTAHELQDAIAEEWERAPTDLLRKLAHSMPQRCREVIEASGDHTSH
jgi:transposase